MLPKNNPIQILLKKPSYLYLPGLFLFWTLLFALFRILFFFFYVWPNTSFFAAWRAGLLTDISVASVLITIPAITIFLAYFIRKAAFRLQKTAFVINLILLLFICFIEVVSLPIYEEWGTTFNLRAVSTVASPGEAAGTFFDYLSPVLLSIFCAALLIGSFIQYLLYRLSVNTSGVNTITKLTVLPMALLLTVGIRGGIGQEPLKLKSAFFSQQQSENYLAVNKSFYFISTLKQKNHLEIQDVTISKAELHATYSKLYADSAKNDTCNLLNSNRPNIILIILEGCTAETFESPGGDTCLTPCYSKLSQNAIRFEQVYASGFRTDQGILSILSGLPALPYQNIMNDTALTSTLPSLTQELAGYGYTTMFLYGGDASYSRFNSYFRNHRTHVIDRHSFNSQLYLNNWGVPDNILFERALHELNNMQESFFMCILTQSTHPPFDLPVSYRYGKTDKTAMYKSCVHFTDSCIGSFIQQCSKADWYSNSIFIITADHGSLYLGTRNFDDHERFRVPVLIFGPALNNSGAASVNSHCAGTHDIPASLLALLHIENKLFPFSKSIFDTNRYKHAFWITEHTMGWITPTQKMVVNHTTSDIYSISGDTLHINENRNDALRFYRMIAEYTLSGKNPETPN